MTDWIMESRIIAPALLSFAAALFVQIVTRRMRPGIYIGTVLLRSLSFGAALCILWHLHHILTGGHQTGHLSNAAASLMTYGSLAYMHADLTGFHRTAIRLQALRFIHKSGGTARHESLLPACGTRNTVNQRVAQYLTSGDLVLVDGKYHLGRKRILYITRTFRFLRQFLFDRKTFS